MDSAAVRKRLERLEDGLSPYACRSTKSLGRERPEPACPLRTEFQRDRDRIIHTKAFRRLKHKTQVFIAPTGDHYVTRLTHTLEVAQIARTIARALNLNEDLVEAMAHAHDLGHTPFGHVGEASLDQLSESGFSHSAQSLRIVERLEKDGRGLNLTWEVRQGIATHSKPRGDFLAAGPPETMTLEAQVLRLADSVAYLNHDIADAIRAGMLKVSDLPAEVNQTLGTTHSRRINSLVTDIVGASWAASGEDGEPQEETPVITMSPKVRQAMVQLREYMFERLYLPLGQSEESEVARDMVRLLYGHFVRNPEEAPPPYFGHGATPQQASADYLAGMTDHYAIRLAERLQPGISRGAFAGVTLG
ncbi:MAG: deoxyguanosinetriphosphate triphosphohydrolase [Dehalococcoidia bacterium]|nr:deoxyguanosinetriphosphate triphosphohydrolase [Dehalococcoidia bacterium]